MAVELVVVSGKGGTGKTSIAASLVALASRELKIAISDCDVDAANLHLLLNPKVKTEEKFSGSKVALIDLEKCTQCRLCEENCRFNAIRDFKVDELACEGCGVCVEVCPNGAATLTNRDSGRIYVSETRYGPMVHARLNPGESNSGKLVAHVRHRVRKLAEADGSRLIVSDGPPGIGCPVISTLTGASFALLVAEPTASGLHDLERILRLTRHFRGVKPLVAVNMWDVNPEVSEAIEAFCLREKVEVLGRIPFDRTAAEAAANCMPLVEYAEDSPAAVELRKLWERLKAALGNL